MSNVRKASDILLDLENKVDNLTNLVRTQDLNIKILSNKLNILMEQLSKISLGRTTPSIEIPQDNYAVSQPVIVAPEQIIPMEQAPIGNRRNSRPETYANNQTAQFPIQLPKIVEPEIIIPKQVTTPITVNKSVSPEEVVNPQEMVSILQKVVDKNGKSVFLADVEIIENSTRNSVFKSRTNGSGNWMASLAPGEYKVFVKKRESSTKEKMETSINLQVKDGQSMMKLDNLILR